MIDPDSELLRRYASDGSEPAFSELVQRHMPLVYSTALRHMRGDEAAALDLAQSVFCDLARKAHSMARHPSVAGWLFTSTRFAAAKAIRTDERRRARETEATARDDAPRVIEADKSIDEAVEEALNSICERDREILILRYFKQNDLRSIAAGLKITPEAARKRIRRALNLLRKRLAAAGITSAAANICRTFSTSPLCAASQGATPATAVVVAPNSCAASFSIINLIPVMVSTKLKLAIASLVAVSAVTIPVVIQQRALSQIRAAQERAEREAAFVRAQLKDSSAQLLAARSQAARSEAELTALRPLPARIASLNKQLDALRDPPAPDASKENRVADSEAHKLEQIIGYVTNLRNRQLNGVSAPLTEEEKRWLEASKPFFKELLKAPDQFAMLQTSIIDNALQLGDVAKRNAVRAVIQDAANIATHEGLLYSADPRNESAEWKRRRHELDRKATSAVQALLSATEREAFDRQFLGVLMMDLTPAHWDPTFEFIDPSLRGGAFAEE